MITVGSQYLLTVLYPLYKKEVYQRREQMMRLTVFASLGLIAMLLTILLSQQKSELTGLGTFLVTLASLIWTGLFYSLILQQQHRHHLAKYMLVQLEETLGLYTKGTFIPNQTFYPLEWKVSWAEDQTGTFYFATIIILTTLFLVALFCA